MSAIVEIQGYEIIDSRGNPTVEVLVTLEDGANGLAAVPSGASTGTHEALELRDGDAKRFFGMGVTKAVDAINGEIFDALSGFNAYEQQRLDQVLIELDGTANKSRLGANAILGVSLAVAKAAANASYMPLYCYLGGINAVTLPIPLINIINGGVHADNKLDIQEFMIAPIGAADFHDAIRISAEVFHNLKSLLKAKGHNTNVGDEGGFAPNLTQASQALALIVSAIEKAGYSPGKEVSIALDCAASELLHEGSYQLAGENKEFNQGEMIDYLEDLCASYPIYSIEDALGEDDWQGWETLTARLGSKIQIVGDDLFVTNDRRLRQGIERNCANAILIKPNQIGTLTETINTIRTAHQYGYATVMSHRSGETEDTTIAELAVGLGCSQIKSGSLCRSERLVKYNQLLRITNELTGRAIYAGNEPIFK